MTPVETTAGPVGAAVGAGAEPGADEVYSFACGHEGDEDKLGDWAFEEGGEGGGGLFYASGEAEYSSLTFVRHYFLHDSLFRGFNKWDDAEIDVHACYEQDD